jgi:hypothetical protein
VDVTGTPGNDAIDGSDDPDALQGMGGDDRLYGHAGEDTLHGDQGDDSLYGGDDDDLIDGGMGRDSLYGGDGDDSLDGGAGDDTLDGGAGDDRIVAGRGADTVVFRDGYDHDVVMDFNPAQDRVDLASSGIDSWDDVQDRLSADADGSAVLRLDDGSTLRFDGVAPEDLGAENFVIAPSPVCFLAGTMIAVPGGAVPVERLRPGDPVLTLDAGAQPVLWIGRRWTRFGHGAHRHQPVLIAAGALGPGRPQAPLGLSPQHRLLVAAGRAGAFVRARALCGRPGIAQDRDCLAADYLQLLLPRHAILSANGAATESFYPGPVALASLPDRDRRAIEALFPGVGADPAGAYGPLARPVLTTRAAAALPAAALDASAAERLLGVVPMSG